MCFMLEAAAGKSYDELAWWLHYHVHETTDNVLHYSNSLTLEMKASTVPASTFRPTEEKGLGLFTKIARAEVY
jgi:hypothetical protein